MIEIVGAPFDLCGKRPGARLGPAAIRLSGLADALLGCRLEVRDLGDLPVRPGIGEPEGGIRHFESAFITLSALTEQVGRTLSLGRTPVVLGGDHSMAIGAVRAALETFKDDIAVLWMDAHTDLNVPGTTPSGNMHGMPVAALLGLDPECQGPERGQWNRLLPRSPLAQDRLAYFGVRELDPGEQAHLRNLPKAYTASMHEIDRHGIVTCMRRFDHWMRRIGVSRLWISFDVDILDPVLAPGTGTAVRGGLTYREAHLVAELINELLAAPDCGYRLVGLDVMETNPLFDSMNETAKTVVEWIASLFGKTILGNTGRLFP